MIYDYGATFLRSRRRSLVARGFARGSAVWRLDWVLLLTAFALCLVGLLLVWSATRSQLLDAGKDPQYYLKRQALYVGVGFLLAIGAMSFDFRLLRAYAPVIYAICCSALVLVLTPLGLTVNGARSWLGLGGVVFQPSEFAKVGLLVMLAMLLGELRDGEHNPRDRDVAQALAVACLPMGLIMLQPDMGTSLVFGVMVLGMIATSGAPRRWLFGLVGGVAVAAAGAVYFRLLEAYQVARFIAFTNPEAAPESVTYSAEQARIAIGSGGLLGKGLFSEASMTSGQYVPEQQNDFIFTVAGEQFGFVGSTVIVVLFAILLWRALRVAMRSTNVFGMLVASGVVCWFGFQAFQSIGMSVGLMPVTGLPLPLVSYGGSSMFASLIAVGLLQNAHLTSNPAPMQPRL